MIIELFGTTCCDGSYSSSTGRGTCSHHGGVCSGGYSTPSPSVPNGLSVECTNQTLQLTWNSSSNSSFYEIYYSPSCTYSYNYLDNVSWNSYTTNSLENCNVCFKIKACTSSSCSSYSSMVKGKDKRIFNYTSNIFRVIDGDTIEFNDRTCRLYGIDTPETYYSSKLYNDSEMCQIDEDIIKKSGEKSKEFIENKLLNKNLKIKLMGKDRYDRDICDVSFSNGINLNQQLVEEGYAIVWKDYIKDKTVLETYLEYENSAKQASKGLWNTSYNVMNCLSSKKSIFENSQEFSFYDMLISTQNLNNGYKKLNINYQNNGDNRFIVNNKSNFELKEDIIFISTESNNIENKIKVYSNGYIQILNQTTTQLALVANLDNNNTIISHEFNTSLTDDIIEYTQKIDRNMIKYFINEILQFTIFYLKDSLMSIHHKDSSKFKNDINISTDSKVWVNNDSNEKSLHILTISSNSIEF